MQPGRPAARRARVSVIIGVVIGAGCLALAGCAGQDDGAKPAAPTIADRVQAIQDDRALSPTDKAIAVQKLQQDTVQSVLAGKPLGQGQ